MTSQSGVHTKGVSAKSVKEWSDELKRSRSVIRKSDPNLILLELEKIQRGMAKYKVPALGYFKTEKPEGVYMFMVIQMNNISTIATQLVKIEKTTRLINKFDLKMVSCLKVGMNWAQTTSFKTLAIYFESEVEIHLVTGHNQNENASKKYQPGGTALLAVTEISEYCKKSETDFRKLGRWSSFTIQGLQVHRTRIVSDYHVRKAKPPGLQSYYHQQRRHIQLHDL